jgi:Protein of unknown function (DUF3305)
VSRVEPLLTIPVGVVIERRKSRSPWANFIWRPVAVLPGVPDAAPWTPLDDDADRTNFYGGATTIALYRSDTAGYRDNLTTGAALLWVVLRPTGLDPPYEIAAVTADPGEGEAFTESATNLVEAVPMPEAVRAALADFVTRHHVEHPFVRRERDRADPEAMAPHVLPKERP